MMAHTEGSKTSLSVAIIGAGIAGLACATALAADGHNVQVLERDADASSRAQGFYIGLRHNGIAALHELGLVDAVAASAPAPESQTASFHTITSTGSHLVSFKRRTPSWKGSSVDSVPPDGALTVSRRVLRRVLLDAAIKQGVSIHWGCNISDTLSASSNEGNIPLHAAVKADLVIAADGWKSAVVSALWGGLANNTEYSRIGGNVTSHDAAELLLQRLQELCTRAATPAAASDSWVVVHAGACLFVGCRNNAETSTRELSWGFTFHRSTYPQLCGSSTSSCLELHAKLLTLLADAHWAPPFIDLVAAADPATLHSAPMCVGNVFNYETLDDVMCQPQNKDRRYLSLDGFNNRRVTAVGDAVHAMTPFAGQGANQALVDAVELRNALREHVNARWNALRGHIHAPCDTSDSVLGMQIHTALRQFEASMIRRTVQPVKASLSNMKMFTMPNRFVCIARNTMLYVVGYFTQRRQAHLTDECNKTELNKTSHETLDGVFDEGKLDAVSKVAVTADKQTIES